MRGSDGTDLLIIEDDEMLRNELAGELAELGYGVAAVPDGRAALERLATSPPPRCVLVDLWMPHASGSDVIEELAADPGMLGVRVVIMTGTPESIQATCLRHAGVPLLSKPFTIEQLLATAQI